MLQTNLKMIEGYLIFRSLSVFRDRYACLQTNMVIHRQADLPPCVQLDCVLHHIVITCQHQTKCLKYLSK